MKWGSCPVSLAMSNWTSFGACDFATAINFELLDASRRLPDRPSSFIALSPWQFLVGSLLLVPLAFVLEGDRPITFTPELIAILAFNGPIASAFGFIAQILVARSLPAVTTSLGLLAVPMAGLLFSAWLLGETIDLTRGLGLVLIIGGLALVAWADRPRAAPRSD